MASGLHASPFRASEVARFSVRASPAEAITLTTILLHCSVWGRFRLNKHFYHPNGFISQRVLEGPATVSMLDFPLHLQHAAVVEAHRWEIAASL